MPRVFPIEQVRPSDRYRSDGTNAFKSKRGRKPDDSSFKAFCYCGKKMLTTTPADVRAGIQPRCNDC